MKAILPISYFGNIQYFSILKNSDEVIIDVFEHFVKQSYRSRTEILGANGKLSISVPVNRKDKLPINEVSIEKSQNWQKSHWKSIESSYRSSPYFEYYEHKLRPFFKEEYSSLIELNKSILEVIIDILKIDKKYSFSDSYVEVSGEKIDYRSVISPKKKLKEMYPNQKYIQVFSDRFEFVPNLSILDLIFNEGPNAINFL